MLSPGQRLDFGFISDPIGFINARRMFRRHILSAAATDVPFKRSQGMIRMHILVRRTTESVLVVVDAVISSTPGIVDLAALRNTIGTKL